jgi:protein phosphatase
MEGSRIMSSWDRLTWNGLTDRGKIRPQNEDSFLCLQFNAQDVQYLGKIGEASTEGADMVFAVSDGMGGAMAGEFASKIAVEKITKLLPPAFKRSATGMSSGFADILAELFDNVHKALLYLGSSYDECSGMGTTLSLCWFTPGWMYFAHIGDSRIYYLPASGGIQQLSHDDTHVGWLYRNGKISEREMRDHPRKNILQKALGAGHQFVDPQVGAVGCGAGDMFLLCTDGVTDGLFDYQILDLLRKPEPGEQGMNPAQRVVAASLERAGRDNTTALVIEIS